MACTVCYQEREFEFQRDETLAVIADVAGLFVCKFILVCVH